MDLKALRQRCEARLGGLPLPSPFDVHAFCGTLGMQRGRAILPHPVSGLGDVSGIWVAGCSADHIFYEQDTSPLHQELIILHELSHLLCGHQPVPVTEGELPRLFFPHFRRETVRRVLRRRTTYSLQEEQEAELLATLILERAARAPTSASAVADSATAHLVRRLEASFEGHRG